MSNATPYSTSNTEHGYPVWAITVPTMPDFIGRAFTHTSAARTAANLSAVHGHAVLSDGRRVVAEYARGELARWQG